MVIETLGREAQNAPSLCGNGRGVVNHKRGRSETHKSEVTTVPLDRIGDRVLVPEHLRPLRRELREEQVSKADPLGDGVQMVDEKVVDGLDLLLDQHGRLLPGELKVGANRHGPRVAKHRDLEAVVREVTHGLLHARPQLGLVFHRPAVRRLARPEVLFGDAAGVKPAAARVDGQHVLSPGGKFNVYPAKMNTQGGPEGDKTTPIEVAKRRWGARVSKR